MNDAWSDGGLSTNLFLIAIAAASAEEENKTSARKLLADDEDATIRKTRPRS